MLEREEEVRREEETDVCSGKKARESGSHNKSLEKSKNEAEGKVRKPKGAKNPENSNFSKSKP